MTMLMVMVMIVCATVMGIVVMMMFGAEFAVRVFRTQIRQQTADILVHELSEHNVYIRTRKMNSSYHCDA